MQKTIDYLRITDRLSIYQRPERDSSIFYLRARIQGRRGYVIRSTGTANESKAREIALETYYDLGLSPKILPATSRALGRCDAHRWA